MAPHSSISLEPIEQKTVTELVAQRVVAQLSNGSLKPGDKLPSERQLARQLQVGRTTVREALKLLTLGGLVDARRGDGTYVREEFHDFLSQQVSWPLLLSGDDLDMIVEVREALEVKAVRMAAQRATAQDIDRIAVFRQLNEIEGRDVERETDLDLEFHHAIATASHNSLLCRLMLSLHGILREYIRLSNQMTDQLDTTVAEHEAIYHAIAAGSPDAAEEMMMAHLKMSKTWILRARNRT